MIEPVLLDRALCLPAPDIAALIDGQLVAAIPKMPAQKGWTFALYPCDAWLDSVPLQRLYRPHALSLAHAALNQRQTNAIKIEAWARCESCTRLYEIEQVKALSGLGIWTFEALQEIFSQQQHLFRACLRVYRLPQSIEVSADVVTPDKLGKFLGLPEISQDPSFKPLQVTKFLPILDESIFTQRRQRLENLEPPEHPELEELYSAIVQSADLSLTAQALVDDIKLLLGWSDQSETTEPDSDSSWITTIASVGNSSEGQAFEKLVRKSLIKLGFSNSRNDPKASLDPEATGGAGGIDFYCDAPYPVVGECKATKTEKVPSKTPGQLIQLGKNHLQDDYDPCIKIIVAAGELTIDAELTTVNNQMNVLRPETLQRLVELKAHHPGAVDLLDLKPHLENSPFGVAADDKVNRYIDQVWQQLKVRSHIVQSVKYLTKPERKQLEVIEIRTCYNLKFADENNSEELDAQTIHELLIELSSPLAGYLGRIRGSSLSSDRFYFLRDLAV